MRVMNDQNAVHADELDEFVDRLSMEKMTRRAFIKRMTYTGVIVAGAGGALHWSTKIEPNWIDVHQVQLPISGLHPAFEGMTLAQISDLHVGGWMTRERLQYVVHRINKLKPDYVAITGDFVTRTSQKHNEVLSQALSLLKPRHDVFGVLGNHDHWTNAKTVKRALRDCGVQELANSFHTIHKDGGVLHLCGLDDAWAKKADVDRVLETLPSQGAAILLAHEPDFADDYAKANRFDVQLAGHTHGGQIQIPMVGPIHLPKYGEKYTHGLYQIGKPQKKMKLYVNRGVGMVWPYVRFHCRPEITLFTLRAI